MINHIHCLRKNLPQIFIPMQNIYTHVRSKFFDSNTRRVDFFTILLDMKLHNFHYKKTRVFSTDHIPRSVYTVTKPIFLPIIGRSRNRKCFLLLNQMGRLVMYAPLAYI